MIQSRLRCEVDQRHSAIVSKSSKMMNRFKSSAEPSRKRECDLRHNEFHAVLLGVAGRDLRQRIQVIKSTDEWLSSMLNADADKQRLQLCESAGAKPYRCWGPPGCHCR
jgi:hypothetical protein